MHERVEPEREEAERPAQTPPSPIATLQRAIGNRAVGALLSRLVDPRLHYVDTDDQSAETEASRLPFDNPDQPLTGWDWETILSHLSQIDRLGYTFSDAHRCAANCALAIAIMNGPRQAISLAGYAARRARQREGVIANATAAAKLTAAQLAAREAQLDQLSAEVGAQFGADAIASGSATYNDLAGIAHGVKVALTRDTHGDSLDAEVVTMAAHAGRATNLGTSQVTSRSDMAARLGRLGPGEAYIVNVDTDTLAEDATPESSQGNHYVVVGLEPGDFGNQFLYDPLPRGGSHFMSMFSPAFWTLFETAGGHWKWVSLTCKVSPPRA